MMTVCRVFLFAACMAMPTLASAQTADPKESALLAQGWSRLAAGAPREAAAEARLVLNSFPHSNAALALLIDAESQVSGVVGGLNAYEQWLGTRRLDDGFALRRIARLVLAALASEQAPLGSVRLAAMTALAEDGDVFWREQLAKLAFAGSFGETRALAQLSDERAVNILISQLNSSLGNRAHVIAALAESRSALPVPALRGLLKDENDTNRAAAADALGQLGAYEAIPELRSLLDDPVFAVRLASAGALQRLNDGAGLVFLQQTAASEHAAIRMAAAKAHGPTDAPWWQQLVRSLLVEQDPVVRLEAAKLIAPYDNSLARGVLDGLLADGNIAVREMAGQILAEVVATDFRTLRALLRNPDTRVQVQAASRILELTR